MACKSVCQVCKKLVISQAINFTDNTLIVDLPAGSYQDGCKYCIIFAQTIPQTATIGSNVVFTIGSGTVQYPLVNRCCRPVTACGIRTRTKYSVVVETTASGATFKMLGNPACSPSNNLTAINGTAPTTDTPVTQAARKGEL
nr:MAG TPA: hypothetical protein [Caudoviricetes sp.]